jgi:heme exporter protein C
MVKQNISLILLIISLIMIIILTYVALIYTPIIGEPDDDPDTPVMSAPKSQKIFYFHVPVAWVSYLAFGIVFISSIIYLTTNSRKWDIIAYSSAEIGVVFCTLAIVTGPIWAKAEWGVYWQWEDLKLFITLILWLIFISYLALRSALSKSEQSARLAAVFGILGFFCVPLSFAANRIWNQIHPTVVATSEGSMQPVVGQALLIGVITFTIMFIYILFKRIELEKLSIKVEELKELVGGE